MSPRRALLILVLTAILTPVAAAAGLYDTTIDDLQRVGGPMLGAAIALTIKAALTRRASGRH